MKTRNFRYFAIVTFLLIIILFALGVGNVSYFMKLVYNDKEIADTDFLSNIGTFGDSAGLLNALFSSLAFGGVILTIIWQVSENSRQRKDEHRLQFENVFFSMTDALERIVSELKVEYEAKPSITPAIAASKWGIGGTSAPPKTPQNKGKIQPEYVTGRAVFKYLYEDRPLPLVSVIEHEGIKGFEREMYGTLDNYFRYLYRILKYIDESTLIGNNEKYEYAGILRAQLSYMELIMVYYNCLSDYGCEKFKPLVEQYHLLKNIREDKLHSGKLNGRVIGIATEYMYKDSAWESEDDMGDIVHNKAEHFAFRMAYAIIFAFIFNTLLSDWWHLHVNVLWYGMTEVIVRGLVLISIAVSMIYYQLCDKGYQKYFIATRKDGKLWKRVWNKLKGNYTLPAFLFLTIVTTYTITAHQAVWYDTHTVYLDLSFFYFPLLADVFALIVNVTREANWEEKESQNLS